jgi:hypothetical protein
MKHQNWNQIQVLANAAAHSEHELLLRCDILPRSTERSRVHSIILYEIHIVY